LKRAIESFRKSAFGKSLEHRPYPGAGPEYARRAQAQNQLIAEQAARSSAAAAQAARQYVQETKQQSLEAYEHKRAQFLGPRSVQEVRAMRGAIHGNRPIPAPAGFTGTYTAGPMKGRQTSMASVQPRHLGSYQAPRYGAWVRNQALLTPTYKPPAVVQAPTQEYTGGGMAPSGYGYGYGGGLYNSYGYGGYGGGVGYGGRGSKSYPQASYLPDTYNNRPYALRPDIPRWLQAMVTWNIGQ